ncbi:hypothetical protein G3I67_03785 [Orrella sp. NBD-18]|uniref:SMP-30/Gluconolactonase/LRE-like region domain-containing protein n=1 Tax=Sheuella amnicola TaxID=2707330 RepID=A0A6B2QXG0_9BURK|nr:SdiA-regulated domain-containing protein [Sheuella amnicola]NDY82348.1 hypothetical protein [Sheuella amnicola]HBI82172.1 hypothetical protein [Alcaligenaceae bacterium]
MSDLVKFLSKILLACVLIIIVGWAVYIGVRYYHAEQVAYRWISGLAAKQAQWENKISAAGGNTLTGYATPDSPTTIDGIQGSLVGLTYDPLQKRLWAVANKPATLISLSLEGQVIGTYPLKGMSEVNGIAWMGGNRVAMVNGRRSRLVITEVPSEPQTLDVTRAFSLVLKFGESEDSNYGFDGLGYDLKRDRLYIAKEHSPRALYRISGLNNLQSPDSRGMRIENVSYWLDEIPFATDLSSVEVDPLTGRVFLLSEESQMIVQLDGDSGTGRGMLSLKPKGGKPMPHPDGVATDEAGNIYIVSEPNLFYRLRKP